ncbi:MAG: membrane protein [bacterium]|nr:MAG: membrane protein [bacterium]
MDELSKDKQHASSFTFFPKNPTECPLCQTEFYHEELRSGGGRLIAGKLTEDLRRLYEDNKKFGVIIPMIYAVTVCPECYYAVLDEDFNSIGKSREKLLENQTARTSLVQQLCPGIDYRQVRNIEHGLLGYILAVDCYKLMDKRQSPTLKRGICSLRISWLASDMARHYKEPVFSTMKQIFYRKAAKYYGLALGYSQTGAEPFDGTRHIGPDTDKNWGYDGFLYLAGLLNYKLAESDKNLERKGKTYIKIRRIMGKLYGRGQASKDKPTIILSNAKDIYDDLRKSIKQIEEELGQPLE